MKRQAFRLNKGLSSGSIVEIVSFEDHGDFWYITYVPVIRIDNEWIEVTCGSFGSQKIFKDRPEDKPTRLPIFVEDAPYLGVGVRAGFTV